jgi:hypothetical protein
MYTIAEVRCDKTDLAASRDEKQEASASAKRPKHCPPK